MNNSNSNLVTVDCLQYSKPERARFEEWRKGGLACVHVTISIWENAQETLRHLGEWNRLFEKNSDLIALAKSGQELDRIVASGRTAVIFGFQDTSPFEDDIELVQIFYDLGVRIVQLTYNVQNRVGAGCWESDTIGVSAYFGRQVIAEMNKLGMLVDISHCNVKTSADAVEFSSRPIAITHANPSEFVGTDIELNRRNKSSSLIKRVVEKGGVIGLSMYPKIMRGGSDCTLDGFIDMIKWTVDLVGVDGVGFGSDFYTGWDVSVIKWWRAGRWARESAVPITGFSKQPVWFQSPADYPTLLSALIERGFNAQEAAKIAGDNWRRLFTDSFRSA